MAWSHWRGQPYPVPSLRSLWLVFAAFLPQFFITYLPASGDFLPDTLAALLLISSQLVLLIFVWLNRHLSGMIILFCGVLLNLSVMTANGGFMPINPKTASRLVSEDLLQNVEIGSRFGTKDILKPTEDTRLEWLSDHFLTPSWFPYQVAFSLGDIFIFLGVFWLLARVDTPAQFTQKGASS